MRLVWLILFFVLNQSNVLADSIVKPKRPIRTDSAVRRDTSRRVAQPAPNSVRRDTAHSTYSNPVLPLVNLDSTKWVTDSIAKADSIKKAIQDSIDWAATRVIIRPILPLPDINKIKFRVIKENRWLLLVSIVLLLLIGLNRILNIKRYDKLLWGSLAGAPIKSNEAVYKEFSIHQIISLIVIALTFAIGIQLMLPFPFESAFDSGLSKYFFIVSVLIFVYVLKAFFYHLVLTVLQVREAPNLIYSQFVMITYALAIAILPLVLVYHYSPFDELKAYLTIGCLIFVVIFFVIRLIRTTIALAAIFPYSIFYLFIYLCTLEIIPWMIILQGYRIWNH
jgi:hypothetical protein